MTFDSKMTRRGFAAGALACGTLAAGGAKAQDFGGLLGGAADLLGGLGVDRWLQGEAPITTKLEDAVWGNAALDTTAPRIRPSRMTDLERTDQGGFILQPGYWQFSTQSYCLHAGTHGPGGGDGYLYAPIRGSQEEVVRDILRNSVDRPQVPQQQVQSLIWAILARAKFEDLSRELQVVAAQLLSRRQIARLNRSAMDLVPSGAMNRLLPDIPGPLRAAFQAEAALRGGLVGGASYGELERIAVLTGDVPLGEGSRTVPSGRWSDHPDGYRIRYFPSGYSHTETEIWVEERQRRGRQGIRSFGTCCRSRQHLTPATGAIGAAVLLTNWGTRNSVSPVCLPRRGHAIACPLRAKSPHQQHPQHIDQRQQRHAPHIGAHFRHARPVQRQIDHPRAQPHPCGNRGPFICLVRQHHAAERNQSPAAAFRGNCRAPGPVARPPD